MYLQEARHLSGAVDAPHTVLGRQLSAATVVTQCTYLAGTLAGPGEKAKDSGRTATAWRAKPSPRSVHKSHSARPERCSRVLQLLLCGRRAQKRASLSLQLPRTARQQRSAVK